MKYRLGSSPMTPLARLLLVLCCASLLSWYLWSENLHARWGIIDDHEIVSYLGPEGNVHLADAGRLLLATEVGNPGHERRYRPSYYTLRIGETILWGNHPLLWYADRMALFALSTGILLWLASSAVEMLPAILFTLMECSETYWSDIWTRLGPGETYAVPGVALYALGFARAMAALNREDRSVPVSAWWLMLMGGLVAIGSKENFLLLLLPVAYLAIRAYRRKRLGTAGMAVSGLLAAYGLFIGLACGIAVLTAKADVYGRSVSLQGSLATIPLPVREFMSGRMVRLSLLAVGTLAAVLLLLRRKGEGIGTFRELIGKTACYYGIFLLLLGLYVSQYLFYSGEWPTETRYDFPGLLAAPLLLLTTAATLRGLLRAAAVPKAVDRAVLILFSLAVLSDTDWHGFDRHRQAAAANARITGEFSRKIEAVADVLNRDPSAGLLVESYRARDYEPAVAIGQFLQLYGTRNPLFLHINRNPGYVLTPFEASLAEAMTAGSRQGSAGTYLAEAGNYRPLGELARISKCYRVHLSGDDGKPSTCTNLGRLY